jgi:cellulose synthase/poly-beta-1,6-N-acetylglucosamine synthase-like glycosyltransferase
VVSYEDVPTTVRQLRIQRVRWGIGSRLVFTRFDPFNRQIGAPGPRFWFWMPTSSAGHLLGPAHLFLLLMSLEFSIIAPDARHNLGKWFAFLLMTRVLTLVPKFLVLAYYRRLRLLPWALLWMPFKQLKRFFQLEALLAFGMRPVKPPLPLRGQYPTWASLLQPRRSGRRRGTAPMPVRRPETGPRPQRMPAKLGPTPAESGMIRPGERSGTAH